MRDLRRYARQTTVQLFVGVIAILFVVGLGLIYWIYGREGALLGLLCLLGGLAPLLLIALIFWIIDKVVKRARSE